MADHFSSFDSSPSSFLWTDSHRSAIQAGRQATGSLFFDELICLAGVDGSLYPPQDIISLRKLLSAIQASSFDKLKKDCLVYYLLKEQGEETSSRAQAFAKQRLIPSQFVDLTDGYWALDNGFYELAVSRLSSISVKPDFTSKILLSLSRIPSPASTPDASSLSARLVLNFLRFGRPTIESSEDVHIKLNALAKTSIREAWMYMRTFEAGEFRAGLVRSIFQYCLSPKPKPKPLQALLAFPFTAFEDQTLSSLCLALPTSPPLPTPSITVLFDLANVRLVSQGRFAEAIKLDRAIGAKGQAAEKRRATIMGLVRLLPEVQRRILELEMDEGGNDFDEEAMMGEGDVGKGEGKEKALVNGSGAEDVEMNGSSVLPASVSSGSSSSHMSVSTSNLKLPLSASQALRTSSPQLAIHRAFIAPSSPGPSSPRPNHNGTGTFAPGRTSTPSTTAFAFQAPTSSSSPRPLPFGDLNKSLFASKPSSPAPSASFGRPQSPFAPSPSSKGPAAEDVPPARSFPQQPSSSQQQHAAWDASPFAQAAHRASALQRSTATPRGGAATTNRLAASSSFRQPVASSSSGRSRRREAESDEDEGERRERRETTPKKKHQPSSSSRVDVEMDAPVAEKENEEQRGDFGRGEEADLRVSQLQHNPRPSSSRVSTKKQSSPPPASSARTTTSTASSRRKPSAKAAPPAESTAPTSSPPPPAKPTRTSHRRTASTATTSTLPPPPAPASTRASSRLATTTGTTARTTRRKAAVVPGAFEVEDEEEIDVVSSPPPTKTKKAAAAAAASRPNTRAASVLSDAGGEDEGTNARRTTRARSMRETVSPESGKGKVAGVRRSTRRG